MPPTFDALSQSNVDQPTTPSQPNQSSSRRMPPPSSAVTITDLPEADEVPTLVETPPPSFDGDKFGELLSQPNAIEEMMSHVQANPQAASMIRGMVNDPAARREMNRLIQNTGADLQMMDSLNKRKNKHRNERPKRKEVMKFQKQNKALVKTAKVASFKVIKITASRQLKPIEVPTETFPHCCLIKICTDANATLGVKEFTYLDRKGCDQYVTLLYVEDAKGVNKLIKQKFGAEYGREVLVLSGTVDNPSELSIDDSEADGSRKASSFGALTISTRPIDTRLFC